MISAALLILFRKEVSSFGEFFNALSALFAGLAFAGLVCTVVLQNRQIENQQREIDENRMELLRQVKLQEETLKQMAAQSNNQILIAKLNALSILADSENNL